MKKIFKEILIDCLKETQADGSRKYSRFSIMGAIWFIFADCGSVALYWLKGVAIHSEITSLTAIILLGVVAGKGVTAYQSISQINGGKMEGKL